MPTLLNVRQECTRQTFPPAEPYLVRWLHWEHDLNLAQAANDIGGDRFVATLLAMTDVKSVGVARQGNGLLRMTVPPVPVV